MTSGGRRRNTGSWGTGPTGLVGAPPRSYASAVTANLPKPPELRVRPVRWDTVQ